MLPLVHAYRDDGQMADTRWKPRRVFCTLEEDHSDAPGVLHVAKLPVGPAGAAALISEVVATRLLAVGGFKTLDSRIVRVSDGFASSCNKNSGYPWRISPGDYYATLHRDDVEGGPPPSCDVLAEPEEILRLWVFDTWLGNIDREVEGNILLSLTSSGKFRVIAADQSDCFCGSAMFCSNGLRRGMEQRGPSSSVSFLAQVIFDHGGPTAIRKAAGDVRYACNKVEEILNLVPADWWTKANINAREVLELLEARANRLEDILKPGQWEVLNGGDALIINV